jgi:TolB-like protein
MAKSEAMTIFRKVREQLHVNVVLEDGVRKTGEKLQITAAQRIILSGGFISWQ